MGAEGSRPGGQGQGWNPGLHSLALSSPEAQTGPRSGAVAGFMLNVPAASERWGMESSFR